MSYHFGMLWIILCEGVEDFIHDTDYIYDHESHPDNFIVAYHLYDDPAEITALDVTYFSFTSLSTVGFGDFHPKNGYERILCAFMLLFGVAVFSYIMNKFIELVHYFEKYNSDFDEGDKLSKFFGTLSKFNDGNPIEQSLRLQIEAFFEYRWAHDLNQAFVEEEDIQNLE